MTLGRWLFGSYWSFFCSSPEVYISVGLVSAIERPVEVKKRKTAIVFCHDYRWLLSRSGCVHKRRGREKETRVIFTRSSPLKVTQSEQSTNTSRSDRKGIRMIAVICTVGFLTDMCKHTARLNITKYVNKTS